MNPEQPPVQPIEAGVPPQTPEAAPESPEVGKEKEPSAAEAPETTPASEAPQEPQAAPQARLAPVPAPQDKDELRVKVERTLEDNLWKIYLSMPEGQRQRFKKGGEMCAETLRALLEKRNVKPKQALGPISRWLKLIPNVLWAFLYQEAKIKTDKFMAIHKDHQEQKTGEVT